MGSSVMVEVDAWLTSRVGDASSISSLAPLFDLELILSRFPLSIATVRTGSITRVRIGGLEVPTCRIGFERIMTIIHAVVL